MDVLLEQNVYLRDIRGVHSTATLGSITMEHSDGNSVIIPLSDMYPQARLTSAYKATQQKQDISVVVGEVQFVFGNAGCQHNSIFTPCKKRVLDGSISITFTKLVREEFIDRSMLLGVLNKPLTGFSYNRGAEQRVQIWRSTIHNAISAAGRPPFVGLNLSQTFAETIEISLPDFVGTDIALEILTKISKELVIDPTFAHSNGDAGTQKYVLNGKVLVRREWQKMYGISDYQNPFYNLTLGEVELASIEDTLE